MAKLVSQTCSYTKEMVTCSRHPSLWQLVPKQGEIQKPKICHLKGKITSVHFLQMSYWTKGTCDNFVTRQVSLLDNCLIGPKSYWTSVSLDQKVLFKCPIVHVSVGTMSQHPSKPTGVRKKTINSWLKLYYLMLPSQLCWLIQYIYL